MPLSNADKHLGPGRAWQVEGSVGTQYTVIEWKATRFVSCNCPDWPRRKNMLNGDHTFQGPDMNHCKHILWVRDTPGILAAWSKPQITAKPIGSDRIRPLMGGGRMQFTSSDLARRRGGLGHVDSLIYRPDDLGIRYAGVVDTPGVRWFGHATNTSGYRRFSEETPLSDLRETSAILVAR
jgi:hypothetical protein